MDGTPAGDYDVIVVGGSFAGLAVARAIRGRVLLLDRNEVGAVQTSACGTPLWVAEALGLERSVLQVHDRLRLRVAGRTVTYDLSAVPFCTFDYRRFCEGLLEQCRVRFLRTPVLGIREGAVLTGEGRFTAPLLVDCSGWRAVLARRGAARWPRAYSFGLETHTTVREEGLWFLLDRTLIPKGIGWIFPVGAGSLVGLGSYAGRSNLRPALERYLSQQGLAPSRYHGTYFPNRLLRPTVGGIFAVGDAAGQCLPLTAEGIRPALYFGGECGRIIQRVLDGALTPEDALAAYRRLVARYRRAYRILGWAQWVATHAPGRWLAVLAEAASRHPALGHWWPRYGRFGRWDHGPAAVAP